MSHPYWLYESLHNVARDRITRRLYRIESLCTVLATNGASGPRAALATAQQIGARLKIDASSDTDQVTMSCLQALIRMLNPLRTESLGECTATVYDMHALVSALLYVEHKRICGGTDLLTDEPPSRPGLCETIGRYATHAGLTVEGEGSALIADVEMQLSQLSTRLLEDRATGY
jgi:hypothetical protein